MGGFATYDKGGGVPGTTVYADNVDFTGVTRTNTITTNGQLLIGSTAANAGGNHINIGTITSPSGTLAIGYSSPNITMDLVGNIPDLHTAKWIVNQSPGQGGNSTTIQNAINNAVSGETIAIFPGTYTENLTLKAGVNLTAWGSDSSFNGTGKVIISGTCSMTTAGSVSIFGIQLQTNSAALLSVTGTAASVVNLNNCYLNCTNNTGITFSVANVSAAINIQKCRGNLGTTGIGLFAHSSTGTMNLFYNTFNNFGLSTTASTISAGVLNVVYCVFASPITTSGTSSMTWQGGLIDNTATNTTSVIFGGSGTHNIRNVSFLSGTASAVSIGNATTTCGYWTVSSSNTNAITGAGTLTGNAIVYEGSSGVNVTTRTMLPFGITGLWTPNLQINASSTGITYTAQVGGYTQIGNVVSIWGQIALSNKGASVGNITISNLPVSTAASGASITLPVNYFNQYTDVGYTTVALSLGANSAIATLIASGTAVGVHAVPNTAITNTFEFRFSGTYIVD